MSQGARGVDGPELTDPLRFLEPDKGKPMAKHTLREILAHFATGAQHTHEAAAQGTYDLGHGRGLEDGKAQVIEALTDPDREKHETLYDEIDARYRERSKAAREAKAPPPPPSAPTGASNEEKDASETGEGKTSTEAEDAENAKAQAGA
jgi:hypothetical protein